MPGCLLLALIKMAEDEQRTLCTGHPHKIPSRSAERDEDGNKFLLHKKIIIIHGRAKEKYAGTRESGAMRIMKS